jgi:hypothetical protein
MFEPFNYRADGPCNSCSGHDLNVGLILEQKAAKETREDILSFSFVVSQSPVHALPLCGNDRRKIPSV